MPDRNIQNGNGEPQEPAGTISREDRKGFERRVADLDKKLDNVVSPRERAQRNKDSSSGTRLSGRGMAYGLRMASELVAAVLVGSAIGYGLDYWFGTSGPWFFLLFFMIGFVAGIMNILRAYRGLQAEINAGTGGYTGEDVTDERDD